MNLLSFHFSFHNVRGVQECLTGPNCNSIEAFVWKRLICSLNWGVGVESKANKWEQTQGPFHLFACCIGPFVADCVSSVSVILSHFATGMFSFFTRLCGVSIWERHKRWPRIVWIIQDYSWNLESGWIIQAPRVTHRVSPRRCKALRGAGDNSVTSCCYPRSFCDLVPYLGFLSTSWWRWECASLPLLSGGLLST